MRSTSAQQVFHYLCCHVFCVLHVQAKVLGVLSNQLVHVCWRQLHGIAKEPSMLSCWEAPDMRPACRHSTCAGHQFGVSKIVSLGLADTQQLYCNMNAKQLID